MQGNLRLAIILLFTSALAPLPALTGGFFYGLQVEIPSEKIQFSNCSLAYHCSGFYSYSLSPGYQRFGWFLSTMLSTITPEENVYGSLNAGVLLGQELKLGPVYAAANLCAGPGISVSDLGPTAGALQLSGELQVELGVYLSSWMQFGFFGSLQGFTNLIPFKPFQHYALYAPVLGLKFCWHS